ncbi:hypothetical protein EI555_008158, partial [Monodon monoceros]
QQRENPQDLPRVNERPSCQACRKLPRNPSLIPRPAPPRPAHSPPLLSSRTPDAHDRIISLSFPQVPSFMPSCAHSCLLALTFVIMRRGWKRKRRARRKRHRARRETQSLKGAQATEAAEEAVVAAAAAAEAAAAEAAAAAAAAVAAAAKAAKAAKAAAAAAAPAAAPAEEIQESPSSPASVSRGTPPSSPAAGTRQEPQGTPATSSRDAGVSCPGSEEGAQSQDEKSESPSQAAPCTHSICRDPLNREAATLVLFMLEKYKMTEPIPQAALLKTVNKKYEQHFPEILSRASEIMEVVFGLELKEVDPSNHSYAFISKLALPSEGSLSDESGLPTSGLLMILLGEIFTKGNRATEEEIWEFLNDLGLAHAETSKMKVLEFVAKSTGTVPSAFPDLYEEALQDEEERA